jgi:hypothetical protein
MGGKSNIQSDSRAETYISHFRLEQGEKRLRGELRGGEKKKQKTRTDKLCDMFDYLNIINIFIRSIKAFGGGV